MAIPRDRFKSRIPNIARELPLQFDIALTEAAEVVSELAKTRCPVETSRLHDAIHVEHTREGRAVVAWSKKAWYGFLVEYGHHAKGGPGRREVVRWVPAHPFMTPAAEAGRLVVTNRANAALKRAADAGRL